MILWLRQSFQRFRSLFHGKQLDRDLDAELRSHLDMAVERNLAQGMNLEQARREALLSFGGLEQTKQIYRERRGLPFLDTLFQDLRFAFRMLRKSPGFSAVAVLTLALGIGANTAIFSLIDAVLLRSLPVRDPNQLVVLQWTARSHFMQGKYSSFSDCGADAPRSSLGCSFPLPVYKQIQSQTDVFSGTLACAGPADLDLVGNGPARIVRGEIVSGDYFPTLGMNAIIGRTIDSSDDSLSASPAAVLSYAYWQSAFGGDPSVLGRTILLNKVAFAIVGVVEPSFTNLSPGKTQDLWLPIAMIPRLHLDWAGNTEGFNDWWLLIMARLQPGVSLSKAQAATSLTFRNQMLYGLEPHAKASDDPRVLLTRAQDGLVGLRGQLSTLLYVLMSAVGLILLIACANIAGLLLSCAARRQPEMSIRVVLGGSRGRILRQVLTESVLLSISGGALGILFAYWSTRAITTVMSCGSDTEFPYVVSPDWRVLSFVAGICILAGIAFGLAPGLGAARFELTPALNQTPFVLFPDGSTRLHRWFGLGNTLVVLQVGLSVVLVIGAGLLVRTLENLSNLNPGFDTRNILIFKIMPGQLGYSNAQIRGLFVRLHDQLAALPGVASVSSSSLALLTGGYWFQAVHVEGQPQDSDSRINMLGAGPDFFRTMGIPLLDGHAFDANDFEYAEQETQLKAGNAQPPAPVVNVLVNQAFARRFLASQNPLGQIINNRHWSSAGSGSWDVTPRSPDWKIVGVVGDSKYDSMRKEIQPVIYVPFTGARGGFFELRTVVDPQTLIPAVRSVAAKLDSNLPLADLHTQTQEIDGMLRQEQLIARVSGFFGVLALLLACIGLYGLLSYEVSRKTREIGVRMALGARPSDVLRFIVRQGIALSAVGAVLGILGALGATRYLASLLYGVRPFDPLTFLAVALLLGLVALAACYVPARRASHVDPLVALRYE